MNHTGDLLLGLAKLDKGQQTSILFEVTKMMNFSVFVSHGKGVKICGLFSIYGTSWVNFWSSVRQSSDLAAEHPTDSQLRWIHHAHQRARAVVKSCQRHCV